MSQVLANGKHYSPLESSSDNMTYSEPSSNEKFNWLLHMQRVRGETLACKELIENEIKRSSGLNEFAYFTKGLIFRKEGRIQEALDSFQTCMKLNPTNPANIKEVARCLFEMRRFRLALEAYLEAEKVSNYHDWQIYHRIGECFVKLGDVNKGKEYAHKAVQLGKHESAYFLLVKILTGEGDYKEAIAVCNAAIEACPDSVNMLTESGLLYLKLGQTQHAFERLSSALALDPTHTKALLGIGCITQSYDEHEVALTKYKVAVSDNLDSVALWNNIGMCFHAKQKYVAAISCLKRALWLSPMNWRVLFNLGLVHLSTYQPASAFNFLCATVNLRPDLSQAFIVLGCALLELKDKENATRAFKQALSIKPDEPVAMINIIICYIQMKMFNEADMVFQHLKELQENNVPIPKEVNEVLSNLAAILISRENVDNEKISQVNEGNVTSNIEENNVDNMIDQTEFSAGDHSPRELDADEV